MQRKWKFRSLGFLFIAIASIGLYSIYNNKTVKPESHIVINSIMKCGSTYVTETLQKNLNYSRYRIPRSHEMDHLDLKPFFATKNNILKLHVYPQKIDWDDYRRHSNKILIQVRDPRQAILSWVHHMNLFLKPRDRFVPSTFHEITLSQQIDWAIANQLPNMIEFMQDWLKFKAQQDKLSDGIRVLITNYDDMVQNEKAFFERIFAFYHIPNNMLTQTIPKDKTVLYRKGDPNEWRSVYTEEQKQKLATMIPQSLAIKFNWKP